MINLSSLFSYEAIPLVQAIQKHPLIHFEWLPLPILQEQFIQRKVDGILCPPLLVAQFQGSLVIPGVGIASSGNIPSPILYSNKPYNDIKTVAVNDKFEHWKDWLKIVLRLLNSISINIYLEKEIENIIEKDACLTELVEVEHEKKYMYEYNLGELWKKVSPYPMVCWVWLCRGDSDYKQIRSLLGYTWDKAKENLTKYQNGLFEDLDLPEEEIKHRKSLEDIYYNIASLEFEGFYWLIKQAKDFGIINNDFEVHIC